jgi:hypothetical protein
MKYTIEPTAVVFDFNYDEAEIFTNAADLVKNLIEHDGTVIQFRARDAGDGIYFFEVAATKANEKPNWILTNVNITGRDTQFFSDQIKRNAIMDIWGIFEPHKLAGTMDVSLETVRSLTDIIQDGKACGETDSIEAQERLLARLHGTE